MKSVKGYFEERLKDPEYRAAYLALEQEHQKRRSRLLNRTKEMDQDLSFLEGFLVRHSSLLGWMERWAALNRLQALACGGSTLAPAYQPGLATALDTVEDEYKIAASTIQMDYNAGISHSG